VVYRASFGTRKYRRFESYLANSACSWALVAGVWPSLAKGNPLTSDRTHVQIVPYPLTSVGCMVESGIRCGLDMAEVDGSNPSIPICKSRAKGIGDPALLLPVCPVKRLLGSIPRLGAQWSDSCSL
jgi:hypothetical protein